MFNTYSSLISIENLFQAWDEFKCGKRNKRDVQVFERYLEDNLFSLHYALKNKSYKHGGYSEFFVNDPKRRHIHKAPVCDRIVHHLLYKYLYFLFDKTFIHKAVKRLKKYSRIVSKNYTQGCWVLKLDIKKFFASVDHEILMRLITKKVKDKNILWLTKEIITSYSSSVSEKSEEEVLDDTRTINTTGKGIPLGNLTSQIFANIYLNELDQLIKHDLKIKYYVRYADDFLFLNTEKLQLKPSLISIANFLQNDLKLQIHPKKIILRKLNQGIDFCGYIVLPHYILPRTKTKRRINKRIIKGHVSDQSLQSYLGYFSHAKSYTISQELKNIYFLNNENI